MYTMLPRSIDYLLRLVRLGLTNMLVNLHYRNVSGRHVRTLRFTQWYLKQNDGFQKIESHVFQVHFAALQQELNEDVANFGVPYNLV